LPDWPAVEPRVASVDAPGVIADAAARYGGSLTIVALGPLTNLALAVERDAAAIRGAGRVVAMGGAVDVPGNVTPDAEFNAHVDPEALARVLDAGVRLDLVPLDATRQVTLEPAAPTWSIRRASCPCSWSGCAPRPSRRLGQRRFHGRAGAAARARRDRQRGHAARRARGQGRQPGGGGAPARRRGAADRLRRRRSVGPGGARSAGRGGHRRGGRGDDAGV